MVGSESRALQAPPDQVEEKGHVVVRPSVDESGGVGCFLLLDYVDVSPLRPRVYTRTPSRGANRLVQQA